MACSKQGQAAQQKPGHHIPERELYLGTHAIDQLVGRDRQRNLVEKIQCRYVIAPNQPQADQKRNGEAELDQLAHLVTQLAIVGFFIFQREFVNSRIVSCL